MIKELVRKLLGYDLPTAAEVRAEQDAIKAQEKVVADQLASSNPILCEVRFILAKNGELKTSVSWDKHSTNTYTANVVGEFINKVVNGGCNEHLFQTLVNSGNNRLDYRDFIRDTINSWHKTAMEETDDAVVPSHMTLKKYPQDSNLPPEE